MYTSALILVLTLIILDTHVLDNSLIISGIHRHRDLTIKFTNKQIHIISAAYHLLKSMKGFIP